MRAEGEEMRRIGPIGTVSRVVIGGGLLVSASLHGHPWGVTWYEVVLGFGVFPMFMVGMALVARHRKSNPLGLTGPLPTTLNCVVILALFLNPITSGAAGLFYGATLLVAAGRGQPGCEATVISNWLLRRDDEVGCPVFSPIDHAELRRGPSGGANLVPPA